MFNIDEVIKEIEKLTIKNPETGCWNYLGGHTGAGYGVFYVDRNPYFVHRLSAIKFLGMSLNSVLFSCHKCDTPNCWNPEHLFVGTHTDNMKDMRKKGRGNSENQYTFATHCINGHEFTPENTYIYASGHRRCRTCDRKLDKERKNNKTRIENVEKNRVQRKTRKQELWNDWLKTHQMINGEWVSKEEVQ